MRNLNRNRLVMLSPLAEPDEYLAVAASRAGCLGVVNLGYTNDVAMAVSALDFMERHARRAFGVVVDASDVAMLAAVLERRAAGLEVVIVAPGARPDLATGGHQDLADRAARIAAAGLESRLVVTSLEEAEDGARAGFDALIAKGNEAGGWVGEETSFILTQRLIAAVDLPVFVQGGIGLNSAAACLAVGAAGVVLDSQLLLARETRTPASLRGRLDKIDGSETVVVGDGPVARYRRLEGRGALDDAWPVGQDAAFAAPLARQYVSIAGIAKAFRQSCDERLASAVERFAFTPGSPLARQHGTRYPFVQGPMTRTSDTPGFSEAVAAGGGLPFVALALMRGDQARELLSQTRELLGDKPWGAGILGFVPPEVREQQLDAVLSVRPPFALIAGGRPAHAQTYEAAGIKTYLHVPTPGLLRVFLNEGSRRFVFEGRECGGHIGPLTSFVLWESMIAVLLEFIGEQPTADISVLFAGGISDGRSTAMVSVLAAPLVSAGVSVGTLSGTAYLFTDEAVATGAILPDFQRAAVDSSHTTTITAGPGYTTRCLPSPFVAKFESEKLRLTDQAVDPEHLKQELEALNIGRLRIATKGLERLSQGQAVAARGVGTPHGAASPKEEALAQVEPERRWQEGLFMIGQAAALRSQTFSIAELHEELASGAEVLTKAAGDPVEAPPAEPPPEPIAVIGMSAILPGAANLDDYWANILDKVDAVTEVPSHRWDIDAYFDPDRGARDKVYSRWGGFIDPVLFDPLEFGLPPSSLPHIEPFQLLGLLIVRDALKDAGLDVKSMPKERTSVIFAAGGPGTSLATAYSIRSHLPRLFSNGNDLIDRLGSALPEWSQDSFSGFLGNVTAGRVANRFDFGGLNFIVDAACASSLAAVALGVKELRSGSSDIVIVGGTDTNQDPTNFLSFSKTGALSPTGRTRPFAAEADGMAISEGLAALVLKRLSDAEGDGDPIYAVIRGVGGASDGRGRSLTAPLPAGQLRAYRRAYQDARVSPASVGLIEAHGTGTVAGDRAELESLSLLLAEHGAAPRSTAVGSVKSMIGHTKIAAGVAGLVKTVKAVHHRVLPPTLGVERPNPALLEPSSALYVNTEPRPWVAPAGSARRAGVSAFGFGGTNFHVVLEEYMGGYLPAVERATTSWPAELFVWRAESPRALAGELRECMERLSRTAQPRLAELAYENLIAYRRVTGETRLAVVATDLAELLSRLRELVESLSGPGSAADGRPVALGESRGVHFSQTSTTAAPVAFLFPGQGSQYLDMTRELAVLFPEVREGFDLADLMTANRLPRALSSYVFPVPVFEPADRQAQYEALVRTEVAQPALGATAASQLRLLKVLGIVPDMVAGHSYGELVALYAAGALSRACLLELSLQRGSLMGSAAEDAKGAMAAIGAAPEELQSLFAVASITAANLNAPRQTVVSGPLSAIDSALRWCRDAGVPATRLPAPAAFHSPAMAGAGERFAAHLATAEFHRPAVPVFSNLTAAAYPDDPAEIRSMLARHLISPVRFVEQVRAMHDAGARIFIELAPKSVLTRFVGEILGDEPHTAIALDQPGRGGLWSLLDAVATLIVAGVEVDLGRLFAGRGLEGAGTAAPIGAARASVSATAWMVDGGAAWPAAGDRPRTEPIDIDASSPEPFQRATDRFLSMQGSTMLEQIGHSDPNGSPERNRPLLVPEIGRYLPGVGPAPLGSATTLDRSGVILVVGGEGTLVDQLLARLDELGYRSVHAPIEAGTAVPTAEVALSLRLDDPEASAGTLVGRLRATLGPVTALVYLGATHAHEASTVSTDIDRASALFALAKEVRVDLRAAATRRGAAFLGVTWSGGGFGFDDVAGSEPGDDWLAGFMKCLAQEWPEVMVRCVDLPRSDADLCARRLATELETIDDLVQVGWTSHDERTTVVMRSTPLSTDAPANMASAAPRLRTGSVILATGGARGITAEACEAIASEVECAFVLVGTTPLPEDPEPAATAGLEDEKSIKSALIELERSQGRTPAPREVESRFRQLLREREIVSTIERIRRAGSSVDYRVCDVASPAAFEELIDSVYQQYGTIDVAIHGAGTTEPRLLEEKDLASFRRVLAAKVTGAQVLGRKLRKHSLGCLLLFSSISAVFGEPGQCDYGAANEVLNKLAMRLGRSRTGRVVAINWGPWRGRGMVRPHAGRLLQERGLVPISLDEGRERFLTELLAGPKEERVVLIGAYADSTSRRPVSPATQWDSEVVVLAAPTREQLLVRTRAVADDLARLAGRGVAIRLQDVANTLNERSRSLLDDSGSCPRLAIVANSVTDLADKLVKASGRLRDPSCRKIHDRTGIYFSEERFGPEAKIALLFPGENSQYPNMVEDLAPHFAVVRRALAEMDVGMPEVLAAGNALHGIVTGLGIEADGLVGHSTGKLAALRAAAVFGEPPTTLIEVMNKARSANIEIESATVLALGLSRQEAEALIEAEAPSAELAADNCPHQVILVVPNEDAPHLLQVARDRGLVVERLGHDQPYHTERFRPYADYVLRELNGAAFDAPRTPIYSCITASPMHDLPAGVPRAITENLVRPVEFRKTVQRMFEDGYRVFIEVGPRSSLTSFVADTLRGERFMAVASNDNSRSGTLQINHMAAQLVANSIRVRLDFLHAQRGSKVVDLDGTPTLSRPMAGTDLRQQEDVSSVFERYFSTMDHFLRVQERVMGEYLRTLESDGSARVRFASLASTRSAEAVHAAVRDAGELRPEPQTTRASSGAPSEAAPSRDQVAELALIDLLRAGRMDEVSARLVGIVSERTGYPTDIIDLGADLEGDLGIDSIRRVEFVGALLQGLGDQGGPRLETLASSRTLRQLLEILEREFGPTSGRGDEGVGTGAVDANSAAAATKSRSVDAELEIDLDPTDEVFMDHSLGGRVSNTDEALRASTVVPLAHSLELMVRVCLQLAPDSVVTGLHKIKANRWIALDTSQRVLVSASRSAATGEIDVKIRNLTEESGSKYVLGPAVEATVRVAPSYPHAPAPAKPGGPGVPSALDREKIYSEVLFHGPAWQLLDSIESTGVGGAVVWLSVPDRGAASATPLTQPHFDSRIVDGAAQAIGCWAHENLPEGAIALPVGIDAIEIFGPAPASGATASCQVTIDDLEGDLVTASVDVVVAESVYLRIRGLVAKSFAVPRQLRSAFLRPGPMRRLTQPLPLGAIPEATAAMSEARLLETELPPEGGLVTRVWSSRILSVEERLRRSGRNGGGGGGGRETAILHVAKEAVQEVVSRVYATELWPGDIDLEPIDGGRFIARGAWMQVGAPAIDVWTASSGERFVALATASGAEPLAAVEDVLYSLVAAPDQPTASGGG